MAPIRFYDKAPYPAKSFGTRGLSLPYSNNIGPFNDLNRPKNIFDRFALGHDTSSDFSYYLHNPADERLLRQSRATKPKNWSERFHKTAIEFWHKFKKANFRWSDLSKVPAKVNQFTKPWRSVTNVRGAMGSRSVTPRNATLRRAVPRSASAARRGPTVFVRKSAWRSVRRRRRRFARS